MPRSASPPLRTVVTGGRRGIGAAVVRRLARAPGPGQPGHEVAAWGRLAQATPPPWLGPLGVHGEAVRLDAAEATDETAVRAAFTRADADGVGLTGLVVSAGTWDPTPVAQADVDPLPAFRHVIDVNLIGTVIAVTAFLRHVRRDVPASIVLVGSTAGQRGEAGYAAYAASKAALMGLAKSWAVELAAQDIRVNVAAPGWVETDMAAGALGDPVQRKTIEESIPRGRVASADEVAGPIAFLLSDDARHVTGTVVSINGGGVLASF